MIHVKMILTPPPQQNQLRLLSNHNDDDYNDDNEDSSVENDHDHRPPVRSIHRNHHHHRRISSFHSITILLNWTLYFDRLSLFMLHRRRRRRWPMLFLLIVVFFGRSSIQPDITSTSTTTNDQTIHENTIFDTVHAYTLTTTKTTNNNIICDRRLRYCPLRKERPRITLPLFATYQTNRLCQDEDDDYDSKISSTFIPSTVSSTNSTTITEHTTPTAVVGLGIRLNKVFTKWYSRRSTDTLIRDGRIQVNDEIVTDLGRRVIPYRDIIRLDSEIYTNWEEHITTTTTINDNNNDKSSNTATTQQQQSVTSSSSPSSFGTADGNTNEITTTSTTTRLDHMEHHDDDNDAQDHPLPPTPPHPTDAHVYIKYWKPVGVISTTDRNVPNNLIDAIYHGVTTTTTTSTRENQNHQRHQSSSLSSNPNVQQLQNGRRIFNVGRLDKDSSGLLLLTSDGRVPNIVLSKQFVHTKVYYVVLDKPITYEHIQQLRHGILITTDTIRQRKHVSYTAKTLPCQVEPLYNMNDNSDAKRRYSETDLWYNDDTIEASSSSSSSSSYIPTTELQITLIEGRNRQIRIMLQSVGSYRVLELHRTQFMSTIDLSNLHHPGDWTYLNTTELTSLQRAITSSSSSSLLQRGSTSDNNDTFIRRQSSKSLLW